MLEHDGDGKTDIAVWRPSSGTWFIVPSSNPGSPIIVQWGATLNAVEDVPVPGDYDGDGKTDIAVWRPSQGTWFIVPSSDPSSPIITQWGATLNGVEDVPVPRDYDGDGKTDLAVWRPSNGVWYVIPSTAPTTYTTTQWGISTDVPVQKPIGRRVFQDHPDWLPSIPGRHDAVSTRLYPILLTEPAALTRRIQRTSTSDRARPSPTRAQ